MSVPVELSALAERIEEYGSIAYLVTVSAEGLPHVVSVSVVWAEADLVVGAGRQTSGNVGHHPTVTLLWPAPPGSAYGLIVDGTARLLEGEGDGEASLTITPGAAVLHRTPAGDQSSPSCIRVLTGA